MPHLVKSLSSDTLKGDAVMQVTCADEGVTRGYEINQTNGATVYQYYNPGGNLIEKLEAPGFP
jgi:hypothetical protein